MKTKHGLSEIRVSMGMFLYDIICVVGPFKNLEKYLRWKFENNGKMPEEWTNSNPKGLCCYSPGYVPVIWLPEKPKTTEQHGTLAHEAFHAMYHLFDWAGMKVTRDTEEVMAHGIGHIVRTILEALYKK